jgi:dipeptidyl aminopeptidase/acylaminoacyl peptidase
MKRVIVSLGVCSAVAVSVILHQPIEARAGAPQGRRPLAIEDYYRIRTVGGIQLSPNAQWVLFTLSTRVEENNGTRSEAYVVPIDASAAPRRIVHEGTDVTGAAWTPESRVRYTAGSQPWQIDPAQPSIAPSAAVAGAATGGRGGRGGRGGTAGGGAGGTPSPDGAWIAQLRDKPLTRSAAPVLTEFERRHEERFKGVTFDWMEFQRDGQPLPAPNPAIRPAQQVVLQAASGANGPAAPKVLVDLDIRPASLIWHPGGSYLAFIADIAWRDEVKYERPDLFTVTPDGTLTRLTDDGFVYSDLDFSPDGRYMSYARSFGTDMIIQRKLNHGGPRDLYVRAGAAGTPINLTASWNLDPGDSRWSPDSRYLYFTADTRGETHLFRVAVPAATGGAPGPVEQITQGPRRIGSLSYDRAFKTMVYTAATHDAPPDIYAASIDGTNERRLSDMHREFLSGLAIGKTDRLRWPSQDGTTIEGWLTHPSGFDPARGPYPLIVFSHGGPHASAGYSFDFKKHFFAAHGYFVLDTNFRSSTGYGDAFKWATWGAWGDKDGQDVIAGIDYVLARYPIDRRRVGHTGHSYGGFMTNWLITQYPDRFAAAVSGAGISNWISDYGTADIFRTKETEFFGPPWDAAARARMIRQSPLTYADRVKTPTLFVHGEVDQRVPYEEAEQMYFALKRRGVPAKMIQYAGQPHGIGGHWNNVHRMLNELRWWNQFLK